jgi:oxalate decarboxylase/phosphoglucose isomerase-like protein (cupin superfamily)
VNIARSSGAEKKYEYGCDLRRLFPWPGVAEPFWGSAIASVRPNEATSPHSHDEEETFIILSGGGDISIDGETASVERGDVIYLPRNSHHTIRNTSGKEPLEFLTIFWGSPDANLRMIEMARVHATTV